MSECIGIVGAGNSASALAAYLSHQGHSVAIYARDLARAPQFARKSITAEGRFSGTYPLQLVTSDWGEFMAACRTVFVATTADCYQEVAEAMDPHLKARHVIILFSSKLFGSRLFARALSGPEASRPLVLETDALFACRLQANGVVVVKGLKDWTYFAAPTREQTRAHGHELTRFFLGLEPADNLLQRGLTDFGAHAHATIMIANISRVDFKIPFLFYYGGLSERTVVLLEAVEAEIKDVARRYETAIIPMKDLLNRYYGCRTENLYAAMTSVPGYATIPGPESLNQRFLSEDVACTLVPLQELAQRAQVATPTLDAVVQLACLLTGRDLRAEGRTLSKLGWEGAPHETILKEIMA